MNNIVSFNLQSLFVEISKNSTETTLFVIDENIEKHYQLKKNLLKKLEENSKRALVWIAKPGEATKNLKEVESCSEFFLSHQLNRHSTLFSIGGGATSDFGGFVASLLLRGISWRSIPTSLLSMVDAALGGKVGVNSSIAKNQIGAFHFPLDVYLCPDFLTTLPPIEKNSGKGEVLKYCFLDSSISDLVLKGHFEASIQSCLKYKKKIVDIDPYEKNERKILNLGHTFGHCLERIYSLPHGIAVAWGIDLILKIEKKSELQDKFKILIEKLELDLGVCPWAKDKLDISSMESQLRMDKKATSLDEIDLIIPQSLGKVIIEKRRISDLLLSLQELNYGIN